MSSAVKRIWIVILLPAAIQAQLLEDIRISIYFGGGDYSVDTLQAQGLYH